MGRQSPCEQEGCSKRSAGGGTGYCVAHGGGKRCQHEGCSKSAVTGGTPHCIAHGGGRRCQEESCSKSARGDTGTASRTAVAGAANTWAAPRQLLQSARCTVSRMAGANGASTRAAPSPLKASGGKRCQHDGCYKSARGSTQHCITHGSGRRCQHVGCSKAAAGGGTPH
jgi:hypothetical protein